MPYTPAMLYQGQPGVAETSLTLRPFNATAVPANTKVIVKQVLLANTTGTLTAISISLVRSGGTAGAANRIVPSVNIDPNSVVAIDMSQVMEAGDFLSAAQATSGAITVTISGVVVT